MVADESEAVACDGAVDILCAETTPKAAKPRIIKIATMIMIKRMVTSLQSADARWGDS